MTINVYKIKLNIDEWCGNNFNRLVLFACCWQNFETYLDLYFACCNTSFVRKKNIDLFCHLKNLLFLVLTRVIILVHMQYVCTVVWLLHNIS